jgi:3-oxocholest-4-en-26-oyl-CoA dehydrogenase alpha subunit
MDFVFTPEQEALRAEVREFIAENMTPEVVAENDVADVVRERGPATKAFFEKVKARGWLAISWPKEWGGQGGSTIEQYVVEEEFARAGLPIPAGGTGAPAIIGAGTEEQKKEFVEACIRGEVVFAMGYTEPQAGADLAALRCRAVRDGDEYVIDGQKTFITAAHVATHIYLMVRTDPETERHAGISILLVPLNLPGITVRPLWTIQNDPPAPARTTYGEGRTNEVFFNNVRVPATALLGEENQGWFIGQKGLALDRVGARRYLMSVERDEDFVNWLKDDDTDAALADERAEMRSDPVVRNTLADLWIEAQLCRLMTMRSLSMQVRGLPFTYEAAAEKVFAPEHGVRTTEAISQILGPYGQLLNGSPDAVERGLYAHNLMGAFQSGINHGSVQVMRDQIAKRGLGMPRK